MFNKKGNKRMVTLNEYDFDYSEEFTLDDVDDYGYVEFWYNNDTIIRVYIDGFDVDVEYSDTPPTFNSDSGNIGYRSYSYDSVSNIDVYTEYTDTDGNTYTEEQFLENNPDIEGLDLIVKQAEKFTKKLFIQWLEDN